MILHNSSSYKYILEITLCNSKFFSFVILNLSVVSSNFYYVFTLVDFICFKFASNWFLFNFNSKISFWIIVSPWLEIHYELWPPIPFLSCASNATPTFIYVLCFVIDYLFLLIVLPKHPSSTILQCVLS
jgi:hypothetical protein